jgi:hypothetical protein
LACRGNSGESGEERAGLALLKARVHEFMALVDVACGGP